MSRDNELPLGVYVDAEQWVYVNRRCRYLEAVMVQVLRDRFRLKEWFTAAELAALRLTDVPATRQGVAKHAAANRWRQKITTARGQDVRLYHCTALPPRAFDELVNRVIQSAGQPAARPDPQSAPAIPAPSPRLAQPPANATPPWVLPLFRLIRNNGILSIAAVVAELPKHLPQGAPCPSYAEAEAFLRSLGMIAEG